FVAPPSRPPPKFWSWLVLPRGASFFRIASRTACSTSGPPLAQQAVEVRIDGEAENPQSTECRGRPTSFPQPRHAVPASREIPHAGSTRDAPSGPRPTSFPRRDTPCTSRLRADDPMVPAAAAAHLRSLSRGTPSEPRPTPFPQPRHAVHLPAAGRRSDGPRSRRGPPPFPQPRHSVRDRG